MAPFSDKLLRVRLIPPKEFVLSEVKVVVPVPADWTTLAAVMLLAVTLFAEEKVSVPKRVVPPTAPEIKIFPPPAAKVKLFPPLTVPERVMFLDAAAVLKVAVPATVTFPATEIASPAVIDPAKETPPEPS